MTRAPTVRVDVQLEPDDLTRALRDDARRGLTSEPKELPPKWFYDDRGSRLFEEITRLDEYYPTRREREILAARAGEIAERTRADTVVELGCGTAEKTRIVLDALCEAGTLGRFVPFDVSEGVLRAAAERINGDYHEVDVHGVVGDFEHHLGAIPDGGRRMIAFLGGTIGNFPPVERSGFLGRIAALMHPGDAFLLGCDLVKDVGRLEAAYDDARGVTAEFNRNVLRVLNRELGADFAVDSFEHVARFDRRQEWMEMLLRSTRDQVVTVRELSLEVSFSSGEEMRTEISAKFRPEGIRAELERSGLAVEIWWTDSAGDFGVALARRESGR